MCQNPKCLRATRAVKVTWRRSWYDGGGNTMPGTCTWKELFVTTESHTNQSDPCSGSVPCAFFCVICARNRSCVKTVFGTRHSNALSLTRCFSWPSTRFVTIDPMTLYIIHLHHWLEPERNSDTRVTFLPDSFSERLCVFRKRQQRVVTAATLNPGSRVSSQWSVDYFLAELCVSNGSFPVLCQWSDLLKRVQFCRCTLCICVARIPIFCFVHTALNLFCKQACPCFHCVDPR